MPKPAAKPSPYRPKGATTRRYLRETRQDLPDQDGLFARQLPVNALVAGATIGHVDSGDGQGDGRG